MAILEVREAPVAVVALACRPPAQSPLCSRLRADGGDRADLTLRGDARAEPRLPVDGHSGSCSGIAVLLDAMLIQLALIPTLLRVFGRHAWAHPRWLDRILPDVRFEHS